jgi:hypothetical protein
MNPNDEMLQLLREIKEAQDHHHNEWQEVVRRAEEHQERAVHDVARAKRSAWLSIGALILALVGINYLPAVWHWGQTSSSDSTWMAQYSDPIATPVFDGDYILDSERSFADIRGRLAQAAPGKEETLRQILAMSQERFQDFRIKHGVITSGKHIIQEFRVTSATSDGGHLQGKAIWHEDLHDPGDCCFVKVHLKLEDGILEFSYSPEDEEPDSPIVLRGSAR